MNCILYFVCVRSTFHEGYDTVGFRPKLEGRRNDCSGLVSQANDHTVASDIHGSAVS